MTYKFIIPGPAQPQEAAKARRMGKYAVVYDPTKSKEYKAYVRMVAAEQYGQKPPLEGPLEVHMKFNFLKAKSTPKKVKYHVKRPDCKNLLACVEDGMNKIVWKDDSQVVRVLVEKSYAEISNVEVTVIEIED